MFYLFVVFTMELFTESVTEYEDNYFISKICAKIHFGDNDEYIINKFQYT